MFVQIARQPKHLDISIRDGVPRLFPKSSSRAAAAPGFSKEALRLQMWPLVEGVSWYFYILQTTSTSAAYPVEKGFGAENPGVTWASLKPRVFHGIPSSFGQKKR